MLVRVPKVLHLLSLIVALLLAPSMARARPEVRPRLAVMGFRTTAALPPGILPALNGMLWQKVGSLPGVAPIAEPQVAAILGPVYRSLSACSDDGCMQNVAVLAGADAVFWGQIRQEPGGTWLLEVRRVGISGDRHAIATVPGATAADLMAALASLDLGNARGAAGATGTTTVPPPPPATAPPGPPPAPPPSRPARPGKLTLETEPPGASILFRGAVVGTTPLRGQELQPGVYDLTLRKQGFRDALVQVPIQSGEHVRRRVEMEATHGLLDAVTHPEGAMLRVDGREVGKAPVSDLLLPVGEHTVEAYHPRYQAGQERVTVKGGQKTHLVLRLTSTRGAVSVTTRPAAASVRIDGQFVGQSPIKAYSLPAGQHEVSVSLSGYDEHRETVEVAGGEVKNLAIRLTKAAPTTGTLAVETTPKGARVLVDNTDLGPTPTATVTLPFGDHVVRILLDSYQPVERRISLGRGERMVLRETLTKAPPPPGMGVLTLIAQPKGAEIVVGGKSFGPGNPVDEQVLMAGTYNVEILLDGYETDTFQVEVQEGKTTRLERRLKKLPPPPPDGFLTVITEPPGARVLVDGTDVGETPLQKARLPVGKHNVSLHLQDYHPVEQTVVLQERRTTTLKHRLKGMLATLKVTSDPPGAAVFLNGTHLGETPNTFERLEGGTYTLIVAKVGAKEATGEVTLTNGEVTTLHFDLQNAPGYLTIRTRPEHATILVDGKEVGRSPITRLELPPGEHVVEARAEGYLPASGKVTIESRKTKELKRFELEKAVEEPETPLETREKNGKKGAAPAESGPATAAEPAPAPAAEPAAQPAAEPARPAAR